MKSKNSACDSEKTIGVALLGFGTVGQGVLRCLHDLRGELARRFGANIKIVSLALRDLDKVRDIPLESDKGASSLLAQTLVTTDWREALNAKGVELVIELIGGVETAFEIAKETLDGGKVLISANKAMFAEKGAEIEKISEKAGVPFFFEAALAGSVPIVKCLREAYIGNIFYSLMGIVNGTSNFILDNMENEGVDFAQALEQAQRLGYAEADPTLDVNGWDAGHKAILLNRLAFGFWLKPDNLPVSGIERVSLEDINFAKQLGYKIKLLAIVKCSDAGKIEARVGSALIPQEHILASVDGVNNAIAINSDHAGESLLYGAGAGALPTASAILSDLADACRFLNEKKSVRICRAWARENIFAKAEECASDYYLRLRVDDKPGVLALIAGALAAQDVGILSVIQPETEKNSRSSPLIFTLHHAPYANVKRALQNIKKLDCVAGEPLLLRIEIPHEHIS